MTTWPRPGDLEAASRPHASIPSGEFVGAGVERCDLCGCAFTNRSAHPDGAPAVLPRAELARQLDGYRETVAALMREVDDRGTEVERMRGLIVRYVRHVEVCEGIDLLDRAPWEDPDSPLTAEDMAELLRIRREAAT